MHYELEKCGKRSIFLKNYWRYYLLLERRFQDCEQYVEISEENYKTYSMEFVNLILSIGSEVDVVLKEMCGFKQEEKKTISDYASAILEKYPEITEQIVQTGELEICPFKDWNEKTAAQSLSWWSAYNEIKHGRVLNYKQANLENTIYSLAALFLLEMYYIKDVANYDVEPDIPDNESKLFQLVNWDCKWFSQGIFLQQIQVLDDNE